MNRSFQCINGDIVACECCPRLIEHCRATAVQKRAAYRDWTYHGGPVPNFGRSDARLLVVGLAPGAHGANRTGRMFTGDRSGDFLYRAMYQAGFANQAASEHADDGLELIDAVITAAAHCAPPDNKPTVQEMTNCSQWLEQTFDSMVRLRAIVALGRIACDSVLKMYKRRGWIDKLSRYPFSHGGEHQITGATPILCSYHPSQQNTFTGRLTEAMLLGVFKRAGKMIRDD